MPSDADHQAAAAARDADETPEVVLTGTPIGVCEDCGERFDYGRGTDQRNLDPCPSCGSDDWTKAGYRRADGTEVPADDV